MFPYLAKMHVLSHKYEVHPDCMGILIQLPHLLHIQADQSMPRFLQKQFTPKKEYLRKNHRNSEEDEPLGQLTIGANSVDL